MGLTHNPVGVSAECPTGDGPHKGFLVRQTVDEVRNEFGEMRDHTSHAA